MHFDFDGFVFDVCYDAFPLLYGGHCGVWMVKVYGFLHLGQIV